MLGLHMDIPHKHIMFLSMLLFHGFISLAESSTEDINPPSSLTCWTCINKTSNEECNNWAPDRQCAKGYTWCRTSHIFTVGHNAHGASLQVSKECVMDHSCSTKSVGCSTESGNATQICHTCCNTDYCNEDVATTQEEARRLSDSVWTNTAPQRTMQMELVLLFSLIIGIL